MITASGTLNKDQVFSGKYCFQSAGQLVYTFEFEPNSASAVQGDGKVKITNANSGTYGYYKYVSSGTNGVRLTYDSTVTGSVEDFYETTITSDGTRDSLVVHYKDSPVGWAATMKLTDWSVYEASIA